MSGERKHLFFKELLRETRSHACYPGGLCITAPPTGMKRDTNTFCWPWIKSIRDGYCEHLDKTSIGTNHMELKFAAADAKQTEYLLRRFILL